MPDQLYLAHQLTKEPFRSKSQLADHNGKAGSGIGPEPSQIPAVVVRPIAGGYEVAVCRTGQAVQITFTSSSEYTSIELYDSLVQAVRKGSLRLDLNFLRP